METNLDNILACGENDKYDVCNSNLFKRLHLLIPNNQLNLLNTIYSLSHDIKAIIMLYIFKFWIL